MNKNDEAISLINDIINTIVKRDCNLENVLLKTNILAFHLKNETLKTWVDKEMNGYQEEDNIPLYRIVSSELKGHVNNGFCILKNVRLPFDDIAVVKKQKILDKVAQLSILAEHKSPLAIPMPHSVLSLIKQSGRINDDIEVVKAYQQLSLGCFTSILSSIKSKLLSLLLNLKEEFGDNDVSFINRKIDNIMEEKIGYTINANSVNILNGNNNSQNANSGNNNKLQAASGEGVKQRLEDSVPELLTNIKNNIDALGLNAEDKDEVLDEVKRVERQMKKQNPVMSIVQESLKVIYGLLIGVTGNVCAVPIIEGIKELGIF